MEPIAVGSILQALKTAKVSQAQAGTKTFTKPKTIVGKLLGGISGRTAGYQAQEQIKSEMPSNLNSAKTTLPGITGDVSFGGEATKRTYLPFVIVGGIVAIFYFMRRKGGRRRR